MRRVAGWVRSLGTHIEWRKLGAYAAIVVAGAVGLYEVGPVATHRQCVSNNRSRQEIKEAFDIVFNYIGSTDSDSKAYFDGARKDLMKGLPQREC